MDMNTSNENLNTPQGARPLGFGYADSVSGRVEMCTWDRLNSAVDSPRVAAVCADLRQLKATRDSGGMTHADYEVRKSRLKKQLPVIMPHAAFPSGHRKNSEAVPSGLAMYDADHIGSPHDYWQHKVLAACDGQPARLGIVLAHITPSYEGLRLIFRIPHGMTPAAAQQWMATRLGDDTYDASVKDYARCSFVVPRGYFFFFPGEETVWGPDAAGHDAGAEDALKVNEPLPPVELPPVILGHSLLADNRRLVEVQRRCAYRGRAQHQAVSAGDASAAYLRQQGAAASQRVAEAGTVGIRAESCGALGLLGSPVQHAAQAEKSGGRGKERICRHHMCPGDDQRAPAACSRRSWARWWRRLPTLPPGLKEATETVEPRLRMGAVLAQLVMIYTLLTRIRFDHFDGSETRLSGLVFIIGPAASGKAFIRELDAMWMEPVRAADAKGRHMEAEYRREKELRKNERKQMERPHPVIRVVPIQISNAMLITRLMDAVEENADGMSRTGLHLYSCETELATAIRSQRGGTWIEKNDIYCKAFHNEPWGVDYASDQVINGEVEVNYNLVISGTEDAFNTFVPQGTVLSGLPTRLMYFPMVAEPFRMMECRKEMNEEKRGLVRSVAWRLDRLGGHVDATTLTKSMYKWCEAQADRAKNQPDYELDDLRKRTALIGTRAGVAYAIMEHLDDFERTGVLTVSSSAIKFARVVADFCLDMQYMKFSVMMRERKEAVGEKWRTAERKVYTADVYDKLPESFTRDDVQRLRPDKTVDANRKLVAYWMERGYVKKGRKKGVYVKMM